MRIRKPQGYRPILSVSVDPKTVKGEKYGALTGICYLAPAETSGVMNVCTMAGNCKAPCLNTSGNPAYMKSKIAARIRKTEFLFYHRELFIASLRYDIGALERKAHKLGMKPCVRVNGTSDLAGIALQMAGEFPEVQFYDYTKLPQPWRRVRPNYHLTFSYDGPESNHEESMRSLSHGVNLAVVFDTKRGHNLPRTFHGYTVVDGDLSDLRFQDPAGVVVGLRAKGHARGCTNGFVQPSAGPQLYSIQAFGA
jgi:hypothetical protein